MRRLALGDLADRVTDRVPAGSRRAPFVGLEHLVPGQLRIAGHSQAADQRSYGVAFRTGDVLFGALRPGFRKVAIARRSGVGSPELLVLRPRPGEHPGLLLAWLAHPHTIAACVAMARGTRMPRVRWSDVAGLRRDLPDRAGRATIGALATLFDDRLDLVHRREATSAALLRELVRRAAQPGAGPTLADVARPRSPSEATPPGSPVLSVADLPSDGLAVHTWGRDPGRSPKRPVRRGDVLVSRLRPALRKSAVCPVDGLASPEIVAWVPRPGWRGVLAGRVLDPDIQARWAALGTGTRMPRVPGHQLGATDIGVPVAAAQELAPTVEPLVDQILRGVELAAALRALRDRALRDRLESTADPAAPLRATG